MEGRGQLALVLNGDQLLRAEVADPLGNGPPGLKAYDAPADQSPDRFLIAWHDFTVEPTS